MPVSCSELDDRSAARRAGPLRRRAAVLLGGLVLWASTAAAGDRPPREDVDRFTVIKAGKVITISGKDIDDGMVVINNGKIAQVGRALEYPRNARVIDLPDAVVMPGLIHPHTRGPLPDIGRSGVNAHLSPADEYVAEPEDFRRFIEAGYTAVALIPPGNEFPGRAAVVRTGGPEARRTLAATSYVRSAADKPAFRSAFERARREIEKVDKARKEHEEKAKAAAPATASAPGGGPGSQPASQPAGQPASQPASQPAFEAPPIEPGLQPLVDLIQKKEGVRVLLEVGNASDFVHLSEVQDELKLEIAHDWWLRSWQAADYDYVLPKIAEKKPRLIIAAERHIYPQSAFPNPLIRELVASGAEVSFEPVNDSPLELGRVFVRLAELVREGLPREAALKGLTLHPARLLGLESRLGSIEPEREADLIIWSADPLTPGAEVTHVMIAGQVVFEAGKETP